MKKILRISICILIVIITSMSYTPLTTKACTTDLVDLDNLCYINTNISRQWRFANYWAARGYRSYAEWYVYGRLQEDQNRYFCNLHRNELGVPMFETNVGNWVQEVENMRTSYGGGYSVNVAPYAAPITDCGGIAVWYATPNHPEHVAYIEGPGAAPANITVTESGIDVTCADYRRNNAYVNTYIMITWTGCNLRTGPSVSATILRKLKLYSIYQVTRTVVINGNYTWFRIQGPDYAGWVAYQRNEGMRPPANLCGISVTPHIPFFGIPDKILRIPDCTRYP